MNIKTKLRAIPSIPNKNICVPIGSMLAVQYFYEKLKFSDIFNKHKRVPLQKIWLFYKTGGKHHNSDIYMS